MSTTWSNILFVIKLIIDVLSVWGVLFAGVKIVRNNNRTVQILKGLLIVFLIKIIANFMDLKALSTMLDFFMNWGVVLVLIILQPEIRSMLEKVGKSNTRFAPNLPAERVNRLVDQIVDAVEDMSKTKTGALITMEMGQSLEDYAQTGTAMDSDVTTELLETIFQYGTPLHDGACIIEGDKLKAAAAYLPSTSKDLPSKYGARHRAAVGISEVTDSLTIVVSEETGAISVANKGTLTQYNPQALRRFLLNRLLPEDKNDDGSGSGFMGPVIQTAKNFSDTLTRNKSGKKNDDRIKALEIVDLRMPDEKGGERG